MRYVLYVDGELRGMGMETHANIHARTRTRGFGAYGRRIRSYATNIRDFDGAIFVVACCSSLPLILQGSVSLSLAFPPSLPLPSIGIEGAIEKCITRIAEIRGDSSIGA